VEQLLAAIPSASERTTVTKAVARIRGGKPSLRYVRVVSQIADRRFHSIISIALPP
jgi:hypothetical protein